MVTEIGDQRWSPGDCKVEMEHIQPLQGPLQRECRKWPSFGKPFGETD